MSDIKINEVVLNYDYYSGEDLYSDGPIEDVLLEFVKNHQHDEYEQYILKQKSWPIFYHLSHFRENIIASSKITKTDKVLEIGSGCGAITGKLAEMSKKVICTELSKKRSQINAYRNSAHINVEIIVGNFEDIESHLEDDFDVVTLIGVFEYGKLFISTNKPFEKFLQLALKHLKEGGRLYIAIENRLGVKYFAGCKEDHCQQYFEGLEGYHNSSEAVTFSKNEFENLFKSLEIKNYTFYYPYPDYKFPIQIYSDEYLPHIGELNRNWMLFDQSRVELFNEELFLDSLDGTSYFKTFSNSFLIEIIK